LKKYTAYVRKDIDRIPQLARLPADALTELKAVSTVLPFRVNNHVIEDLIDWDEVPDDPMFQLTFPQRQMLDPGDFQRMVELVRSNASQSRLSQAAWEIQQRLNPHPEGQMSLNVPTRDGDRLPGIQHKYRETVLFFPSQGQTCHAYCTYCFRWAQFIGVEDLRFAARNVDGLLNHLREHPEVTDVLFTGGDPLMMKTAVLRRYLTELLDPELESLTTIRIGTKSTAYWPYRFTTDRDAGDLLRLFEEVSASGRQVALMVHFSHPRELEHPEAQLALRRIRETGAVIRSQAPLIEHVNNDPGLWAEMWRSQLKLGVVPYYMFVERDTGPKNYFEVPLSRAYQVFTRAVQNVTGLARTVRGPSMSTTHGKVLVMGETVMEGQRAFVLMFIQARNPAWVGRPFFAKFNSEATWLDDLEPLGAVSEPFFGAPEETWKTLAEVDEMDLSPLDDDVAA